MANIAIAANNHRATNNLYDDSYFPSEDSIQKAAAATSLMGITQKDKEWKYIEAILDSGCTTTLLGANIEHLLTNTRSSTTNVRGFEGDNQIRGRIHGTAHAYFISTLPKIKGRQMDMTVDTIATLNCPLFSVSSLFARYGFSILLRHPNYENGIC